MSNGVDKNQLAAVLQVLKKYNLKVSAILDLSKGLDLNIFP